MCRLELSPRPKGRGLFVRPMGLIEFRASVPGRGVSESFTTDTPPRKKKESVDRHGHALITISVQLNHNLSFSDSCAWGQLSSTSSQRLQLCFEVLIKSYPSQRRICSCLFFTIFILSLAEYFMQAVWTSLYLIF